MAAFWSRHAFPRSSLPAAALFSLPFQKGREKRGVGSPVPRLVGACSRPRAGAARKAPRGAEARKFPVKMREKVLTLADESAKLIERLSERKGALCGEAGDCTEKVVTSVEYVRKSGG